MGTAYQKLSAVGGILLFPYVYLCGMCGKAHGEQEIGERSPSAGSDEKEVSGENKSKSKCGAQ